MTLYFPLAVLLAASLIALSSISTHLFLLQLAWIAIGIGLILLFYFFDWKIILNYRWIIGAAYVLSSFLLLASYLTSPVVRNVRSWIFIGPISFEPVELMKIALILAYASYFSRRHLGVARWKHIITSFLIFLIPASLTALQPDLGSALILFGIWFGFLVLSGLPPRRFFVAIALFILVGIFMWSNVLKDYQRGRIEAVFYPSAKNVSISYSAAQSKIAIGSAGLWGKGYRQGSELQLGFLTEPVSDFIFAALVEEWGIFGGLVVIGAFVWLIYCILRIGWERSKNFEKFICLGTATMLGLQFILNMGSELGLTPVIGVTLPFVSYGGSSLFANFLLISIVSAMSRER